MKRAAETISPSALFSDFRLLVILAVSLRLLLLVVHQPIVLDGGERGITAGGDFLTYFQLGSLSADGLLPFRDWWSEFPPVPSALNVLLFQLGGRAGYTGFAMLYGLLMLACDALILAQVRAIGSRIHGAQTGMALAWIYALLAAPLVLIWWTFEPLVALTFLLGLRWLLEGRDLRAGAMIGFGALVKFTPALLLGALLRYRAGRSFARVAVVAGAVFGVVYGLLFVQNAAMTAPSVTAQFSKASYQTVWALLDGNYRTGNFGSIDERLDPANAAVLIGNPSVVPGWLRLAAAAAIGLLIFARTRRFDDKGMVYFAAITLVIFFLQAQGWSPQWLAQIVPLLLLAFPTRDGILTIVLLSAVTFAEYPFLWIRTGDTGGVMTGALVTPYAILVIARTLTLVGACVGLYQKLRQKAVLA
ncbi:MAG: DUF2029 domain-containing protein [Pleurocapsa minor GSE-CHR-MK-17-07R]|jgi:hypothetical protein|nr:DUF2029 domain-containing protein [Pleurocapsa minor GSE-CHR-MK 17-07R]